MGITGAGKSTFIQKATADPNIPIGDELKSGKYLTIIASWLETNCKSETKNVQEYILVMENNAGVPLEVHLIDTPGFDDDFDADADVLHKVASWINAIFHNEKERISGVLYLHDITLGRIRGSGLRNLEMLPKFLGQDQLEFCTLVTTHWGTLKDSTIETKREDEICNNETYWKSLLGGYSHATMERFNNTEESAWTIIGQHLRHLFIPAITEEMVVKDLPLDRTGAGQIVSRNLDEAYKKAKKEALEKSRHGDSRQLVILEQKYKDIKDRMRDKFNEQRTAEFKEKSKQLRKKQIIYRAVRWTARIGAIGGITTGIVLTAGALTPLSLALPAVEAWCQVWSGHDKEKRDRLHAEYNAPDEKDFRLYQKVHGFSDEDLEELVSVYDHDSDSDDFKSKDF
jgi:hypothetical protein